VQPPPFDPQLERLFATDDGVGPQGVSALGGFATGEGDRLVAIVKGERGARCWDVATGNRLPALLPEYRFPHGLTGYTFTDTTDGRHWIIQREENYTLTIMDVEGGKVALTLPGGYPGSYHALLVLHCPVESGPLVTWWHAEANRLTTQALDSGEVLHTEEVSTSEGSAKHRLPNCMMPLGSREHWYVQRSDFTSEGSFQERSS
jgi:hypothetical protein